jgi:hypothetical protein
MRVSDHFTRIIARGQTLPDEYAATGDVARE